MDREPCPFRIVDDAGGAFGFGLVGGAIWNFFGGIRNAPSGSRLQQAFARVSARTPILGGSFAIWGTLFSICDCSFTYIRKKEDPWNAIASGAATGGILAMRGGLKSAGKNAAVGGVLLAAIEGLNIAVTRYLMPMMEKQSADGQRNVDTMQPPVDPLRPRRRKPDSSYKPLSPLSRPGPSGGSSGFNIDTVPDFQTDSWDSTISNNTNNSNNDDNKEKKPFWNVWS